MSRPAAHVVPPSLRAAPDFKKAWGAKSDAPPPEKLLYAVLLLVHSESLADRLDGGSRAGVASMERRPSSQKLTFPSRELATLICTINQRSFLPRYDDS